MAQEAGGRGPQSLVFRHLPDFHFLNWPVSYHDRILTPSEQQESVERLVALDDGPLGVRCDDGISSIVREHSIG